MLPIAAVGAVAYAQTTPPAPMPITAPPVVTVKVVPVPLQPAKAITIKDLFSGAVAPRQMLLKDLDASWVHMQTGAAMDANIYTQLFSMFRGISGYFSRGETVSIGGETYLIAYSTKTQQVLPEIFAKNAAPTPVKVTPDMQLELSLLNIRTTGSFTNIRPFVLAEELAANEAAMEPTTKPEPPTAMDTSSHKVAPKSPDNMKQLGLALMMYTQDYDEVLPPVQSAEQVKTLIMPYVKNSDVFYQPGVHKLYTINGTISKHKLVEIKYPASFCVYYEPMPGKDGSRWTLYMDGHVKKVTPDEWEKVKKFSKITDK